MCLCNLPFISYDQWAAGLLILLVYCYCLCINELLIYYSPPQLGMGFIEQGTRTLSMRDTVLRLCDLFFMLHMPAFNKPCINRLTSQSTGFCVNILLTYCQTFKLLTSTRIHTPTAASVEHHNAMDSLALTPLKTTYHHHMLTYVLKHN